MHWSHRNSLCEQKLLQARIGCNAGEISTRLGIPAPCIRSDSAIFKLSRRRSRNASNSGHIAGPRGRLGSRRVGRKIQTVRRAAGLSAASPHLGRRALPTCTMLIVSECRRRAALQAHKATAEPCTGMRKALLDLNRNWLVTKEQAERLRQSVQSTTCRTRSPHRVLDRCYR